MKTLFFAIFFLCTSPAFSQTQMEMNESAAQSFNKADKELNKVYGQLVALLDANDKAKLVKAQRAWILFRDAQAVFAGSMYEGGSLEPFLVASEKTTLTNERIRQLKAEIKNRDN